MSIKDGGIKQRQDGADKMKMAVTRGVMDQMKADGRIGDNEAGCVCPEEISEIEIKEEYWDDISG